MIVAEDNHFERDPRLARVLGLLYTAAERYAAIGGRVQAWVDPVLAARVREVEWQMGFLEVSLVRGFRNDPGPGIGSDGVTSRVERGSERLLVKVDAFSQIVEPVQDPFTVDVQGRPRSLYPGWGGPGFGRMLRPRGLISDSVFSVLGQNRVGGRDVFAVVARPRRQWHETGQGDVWGVENKWFLKVDAQVGVVLEAEPSFGGRLFSGRSMDDLEYELRPRRLDETPLERIGEVVYLLYGAQFSFQSAYIALRHWDKVREWRNRIWAAAPGRFREERLDASGKTVYWFAYDGEVWWHGKGDGSRVSTNAHIGEFGIAGLVVRREPPLDSAARYYGVKDGEYAIIAEIALNPSFFISGLRLERVDTIHYGGRRAFRVIGVPVPSASHRWAWWRGADSYELLVDAERGVLLRFAAVADGVEFAGHEVLEVKFDDELPEHLFRHTPRPGTVVSVH